MSGSRAKLADLYGQLARTYADLCRELGGDPGAASSASAIAPDSDLDSQWGDEEIKKDPPRWKKTGGPSFANRHMSECSPEFLDCYAEFKDWTASQNDEKARGNGPDGAKFTKYAGYDRKSAARARGWAQRLRNGWKREERSDAPPSDGFDGDAPPSSGQPMGGFDDNPFDGGSGGWDE